MNYGNYYDRAIGEVQSDITANKANGERLRRMLAELRRKRREAIDREPSGITQAR